MWQFLPSAVSGLRQPPPRTLHCRINTTEKRGSGAQAGRPPPATHVRLRGTLCSPLRLPGSFLVCNFTIGICLTLFRLRFLIDREKERLGYVRSQSASFSISGHRGDYTPTYMAMSGVNRLASCLSLIRLLLLARKNVTPRLASYLRRNGVNSPILK